MADRRDFGLDPDERLRYRGRLRSGREVAVTDDRLLIAGKERVESVPYTNVSEVTNERFDWFLALMSLALCGVGVLSLGENILLGAGMVVFGAWSLRRTYGKRDRVRIHTHSRPKPIEVYPADVEALYATLEPAVAAVREREDAGKGESSRERQDRSGTIRNG